MLIRLQSLMWPLPVALLLVVTIGGTASAVERADPLDSALKLDIALIKFVEDPEEVGRLTIKTYAGWRCRALRPGAERQLKWFFDATGSQSFDLNGSFVCRDRVLLFKLRGGGNAYEPIVARKPNRRTVKVRMPLNLSELDSNRLDLVAKSKDLSEETCTQDCVDRAPNQGRMQAY